MFKQLFGGGSAKLVLTDDEDIIEAGIEIIARPPGKNYNLFRYYLVESEL